MPILTVGPANADIVGTTNVAIQAAVDQLAMTGGGIVALADGVYEMEDALHLRSGITVRGTGAGTVLHKAPGVSSAIRGYMGYGHYDISMEEPDKFHVGMGVHIRDNRSGGFYETVATLTWREGERYGISRFLNHDYDGAFGGMINAVFPIISGIGLEHAAIEQLTIEGNKEQNPYLGGCRGGGVYLSQAHEVAMRGLTVRNYHGDGISFQQCRNTLIEDCTLERQNGSGVHPGSGSVGAVMRRLVSRDNAQDGIFYCLRVSYSLCEDCVIEQNGGNGVSIGGRDTDHLLRRLTIRHNGGHAVYTRPDCEYMGGSRNRIEHSEIGPNCQTGVLGEIYLENVTTDFHILDNVITATAPPAAAPVAVFVAEECRRIVIAGNTLGGEDMEICRALCPDSEVSFERPTIALPVGPDARRAGAARHLTPEEVVR